METLSFSSTLVLLISINIFTLTSSKNNFNSTTDKDALLAFKDSITSSPNGVDWSFNSSVCNWTGVSCSIKHQRVTALNLSGFGLRGTLAPHLGNLTFLQSLDISHNNFTGSLPPELSKLRRLKEIKVAYNDFTGEIPRGLFTDMSELVEIDLRYNMLSGQLPSDTCRNTPKLRRIYLRDNQLSGRIPTSIEQCTVLEELGLGTNQFNGSIPTEIGNLSTLTFLSFYQNHLQGGIPKEIGYLTSLNTLYLSENYLTGHIPKHLGNLTSLVDLDLASNKLTGELPEELGNLATIEYLGAGFNDFLKGSIPSSIFNISSLKIVSLQQNQLSGVLPSNMGNSLPNLEELYLFWNKFSGEIPRSISNASKLTMLELNNNSFTGSIPDFGKLRLLQALRLWMNNLTSPNQELTFLSSLTNSSNLKYLEISFNPHLNGILPPSIGNLSTSSLVRFSASDCNIRGVIPSELGNLSSLQTLDLSGNQLTGFIPTTLAKLKQIGKLHLYDNQLQGSIPPHLCQMSNLMELNLSSNSLTGPIPECLGEVKSLRRLSFASNNLNSTLPSTLFNLVDLISLDLSSNSLSGELPADEIPRLKAMNQLNLSSNKFEGSIPESIGSCVSLETLILSNNSLNGSIPQSLGEMKALGLLDLSYNNLSGRIPDSLTGLNLTRFNVSYNKLEGEIPDKANFRNLSAQSFLHNSALCGAQKFQVSPCRGKSRGMNLARVLVYIILPFVAVLILAVGLYIMIRRYKPKKSPTKTDDPIVGAGWKVISEIDLKQRTNSFSETNLLGRGSFGSVFKATDSDGTEVAVKVFNLQSEGAVESFQTESHILSTIRHRNLVKILGCSSNPEFKALILAYMPNGSLEKWLHSDKFALDLMQRLNIATDVALALEYLHHNHTFPVVHRDIKPSNVLLDADLIAHVGDFGISKLFENNEAAVHTLTMATVGYIAPEFGTEGKVSTSGDVYSYGILLLEIFTSKRPSDDMFDEEMSIKVWAEKALQEDSINEIVAPALLSREDKHFTAKLECVKSVFDLAMKCLASFPEERINMMQAVAALHKIKAKVPVKEVKSTNSQEMD